jgi:hypothetical protein
MSAGRVSIRAGQGRAVRSVFSAYREISQRLVFDGFENGNNESRDFSLFYKRQSHYIGLKIKNGILRITGIKKA